MSYRIELIPPARAEIRALPEYVRGQALELVADLGSEPRPPRAKILNSATGVALRQPDIYRIWLAGRWRIAYEIDDDAERILVLCLRYKEDSDYDKIPSWLTESGSHFVPVEGIGATPATPGPSGRDRGPGR